MRTNCHNVVLSVVALFGLFQTAVADWPTWQNNNQRNAVTTESLTLPLQEAWCHYPLHLPQPAWPPPARQDFYHGAYNLQNFYTHEEAFQVVISGGQLYYASPRDHALIALSSSTGELLWKIFAEAPVRYAPTLANGRIYFGADDGRVYCVDRSGKELWQLRVSPEQNCLPGNGHVISYWPVRSGILIEKGQGIACAGLLPGHKIYRIAFDPIDGKLLWRTEGSISDGYMALSGDRVIAPTCRSTPSVFNLNDGKSLRSGLYECAGTYVVVDGTRILAKASRRGWSLNVAGTRYIHPARFAVFREGIGYFLSNNGMQAIRFDDYPEKASAAQELEKKLKDGQRLLTNLEREKKDNTAEFKKQQEANDSIKNELDKVSVELESMKIWQTSFTDDTYRGAGRPCHAFIMAGDLLFAGHEDAVVAYSTKDGKEVWRADVPGEIHGLAVSDGCLYVSSNNGAIHCFTAKPVKARKEKRLVKNAPDERQFNHPFVQTLLTKVSERAGYCLVLGGWPQNNWPVELAVKSNFKIVVVESDRVKIATIRSMLDKFGLQGQITIHEGDFEKLPYPDYFANIIVVGEKTKTSPAEVLRVLQPYHGISIMSDGSPIKNWAKGYLPLGGKYETNEVLRRGPLPAAGSWSHQYAAPDNSNSSGDCWVRGDVSVLWFGEPGPREMIDRHNRTMASLFNNGLLFVPANERIIALNPYNGTRLWDMDVPGSRRVGVLKDAAQMALGREHLYIAVSNQCLVIDQGDGSQIATLTLPEKEVAEGKEWGYLAAIDRLIIGTAQKAQASFGNHMNMCNILEGDFRQVIASESIFCREAQSGSLLWQYHNGVLLNSCIAAAEDNLYFLESMGEELIKNDKIGRVRIDHFLKEKVALVALDLQKGQLKWRQSIELPFEHIIYLLHSKGSVIVMGTYNKEMIKDGKNVKRVHYGFFVYDELNGELRWNSEIPTEFEPGGSHGEQWQHPFIIEDEIFTKYFALSLRDGKRLPDWKITLPSRCGTQAASAAAAFGRGSGVNLDTLKKIGLSRVNREGCFVNLIPAGGILSVPEASAGCTCDHPIQASFAYVPKQPLAPVIYPLHRKFERQIVISMTPCLEGWQLRYTLDGSEPDERSPLYVKPFELNGDVTIKARLWGPQSYMDVVSNSVATAVYTRVDK